MSILSHYERVDTWGRGGRQGLAPQVPGDLALAHTPSSTMRPSLGRAPDAARLCERYVLLLEARHRTERPL